MVESEVAERLETVKMNPGPRSGTRGRGDGE